MGNFNKSDLVLFNSLLDLKRKVVGIKFLFDEKEYEDFDANESQGMMTYCTMVRNASVGKSTKANINHFACLSAARALGLIKPNNDVISGRIHAKMGVYNDLTVARSIAKDMVYCDHEVYGIGIKPLEEYICNPDILIIVTNPLNVMRIIQGYAFYNGQLKEIKMAGMQAICQECTSYTYEKNTINISMMCSGTRHVSQWGEDEMAVGIPYNKFNSLVEGIKNTVNPMERNYRKKKIEKNLKENKLDSLIDVEYSKNYYTGVYTGIKNK